MHLRVSGNLTLLISQREGVVLSVIRELLELRLLVGFLGEKKQFAWWQSDFFNKTAPSFLNPVFPRTRFLAQFQGASAAARQCHDKSIGVGNVFHLFRLTEDLEQSFQECLGDPTIENEMSEVLSNQDAALDCLKAKYGESEKANVGPVLIGDISEVISDQVMHSLAGTYVAGFLKETHVFPYLKNDG